METANLVNPIEETQIRFAAEIFGWMQLCVVARHSRPQMARFLKELALPVEALPDPAEPPESALRMICESDSGVRERLGLALRHLPLYVALSARLLPQFVTGARLRHAAWLYLNPAVARTIANSHRVKLPCSEADAEEFLTNLECHAADQAMATRDGAPQAA